MGFLFSVKGLRAIGVTQRPFVGLLSQLESSTRFGFVLWDWISRFRITRDTIGCVLGFLFVVTLIAP